MKVIVAGAGPGAASNYTGQALDCIRSADVVLTAARLAESLKALRPDVRVLGVMDTVAFLNENIDQPMTVCVAASGDTGFYSIASTIAKGVDPRAEVEFVSGVGSLSYFASKLKMGYEDMKLGQPPRQGRFHCASRLLQPEGFLFDGRRRQGGRYRQPTLGIWVDRRNGAYSGENLSSDEERWSAAGPRS